MIARTRWLVAAAALVGAALAGAQAAPVPPGTAASGLAAVPAQAPIVIQLRGVERTKDRLTKMLNAAIPDFGPLAAAQLDQLVQGGVEGRTLKGLTPEGPVFIAFLEMPTPGAENPPVALIARVTSYTAFRNGLLTDDERKNVKADSAGYERAEINGKEFFFIDRQGFAAITPNKDAAALLAKKQPGLDGKLSGEVARELMGSDLSLYVNLAAVNKEYGDQIKGFRQLMEQALEGLPAGGGAEKASMEMIKTFYGGLFQAVEDGRALVAALDFRPEGLNLHLQAQVGSDTKTNKLLQEQRPASLDALGTLPAGLTTYTGTHMTSALLKAMAPMLYGVMGGEGEAKKQVQAALNELIAAGNTNSFAGASFPPAGLQVQQFQDPAKAADAQLKLFRAMGEGGTFQNAYVKGKPELKTDAQEYKGFKFNYAHITWDLDKFADALPGGGEAAKNAMKKLMGEGLKNWFGTDGRRYLSVTAKDWDAAKALIDAYLGGRSTLGEESAYKATRKELPAETTMLFLADAGRFTYVMGDYLLTFMKAVPGLPFNLPDAMKPVATKTSYLGAAVTLKPEHASFDLFLPVTGVQEIRKVIMPLFQGGQ